MRVRAGCCSSAVHQVSVPVPKDTNMPSSPTADGMGNPESCFHVSGLFGCGHATQQHGVCSLGHSCIYGVASPPPPCVRRCACMQCLPACSCLTLPCLQQDSGPCSAGPLCCAQLPCRSACTLCRCACLRVLLSHLLRWRLAWNVTCTIRVLSSRGTCAFWLLCLNFV